jgi:hypothetical protein
MHRMSTHTSICITTLVLRKAERMKLYIRLELQLKKVPFLTRTLSTMSCIEDSTQENTFPSMECLRRILALHTTTNPTTPRRAISHRVAKRKTQKITISLISTPNTASFSTCSSCCYLLGGGSQVWSSIATIRIGSYPSSFGWQSHFV